ncbi:DASH family cryptochrome [Aureisphaera galaxeae]|uniref:DASH family cryptochrome n=1 Tax=Aureisphaera galaxeae TaxID=1538023 RepID=UPI0023508062|nr:DASH family cryptochrome [Aureisphaera galaxeae]MDC8006180.1 DASH family cryptochrome [Aureisphaera galaxeae]
MQQRENKAIVWYRNHLRTIDNEVLYRACKEHDKVVAVYCFSPTLYEGTLFGFRKVEKFRAQFIIQSVRQLKQELEDLNIDLLVYHELPSQIIPKVCADHHINALYLQKEWTSEEVKELDSVKRVLPQEISVHEIYNQFLYHPDDNPLHIESIPKGFTSFRKKMEKKAIIRPTTFTAKKDKTNRIENPTSIPSLGQLGYPNFETHPHTAFPFKGGERSAVERLESYFFETKRLGVYKKTRNGLVGSEYSSKFSPWLAIGCVSARTIYWKVKEFEDRFFKNESTYWLVFELIWRDFFKYISLKHGNAIFKRSGILHKDYARGNEPSKIEAWIHGSTPEPFVNANMVELKETGWMSNRGRQNVASYFAKTCDLDWRIGAAYFESMLIDYDVHSNYGNWMYVAGVGNDPRDRVFNVRLQSERYDPSGSFQKRWLQPTLF